MRLGDRLPQIRIGKTRLRTVAASRRRGLDGIFGPISARQTEAVDLLRVSLLPRSRRRNRRPLGQVLVSVGERCGFRRGARPVLRSRPLAQVLRLDRVELAARLASFVSGLQYYRLDRRFMGFYHPVDC